MKSYNIDVESVEGASVWPDEVRLNAVVDVKEEAYPNEGDVRTHLHFSHKQALKAFGFLLCYVANSHPEFLKQQLLQVGLIAIAKSESGSRSG